MWINLGWAAFFVWHWIRSGDEWFAACAMAAVSLAIMCKTVAYILAPVPKRKLEIDGVCLELPDQAKLTRSTERPYHFGNGPFA